MTHIEQRKLNMASLELRRLCATLILLGCMVAIFSTRTASAGEKTARKGFIIGLDAGGGGLHFENRSDTWALLLGLKIGAGVSERTVLLAESTFTFGASDSAPIISRLLFSSQIFHPKNFYIRPGIGLVQGKEGLRNEHNISGFGFSASLAAGYEWRLTKRFCMSPEGQLVYTRLNNGNHYSYGGVVDLRWYF